MDKADHLLLGASGERYAVENLKKSGYKILDQNWRFGHLELDIVCLHKDVIVFVEVKTRRHSSWGGPAGAMTGSKKRKLIFASQAWLTKNNRRFSPCRFDVICLVGQEGNFQMEHFQNAFDISQVVDHSNSNWKYW